MIGGETTMNLNDFRHAEHIVLEEQTLPMNALDEAGPILSASIDDRIEAACDRIAPVWPLDRFVAVNPFHGLRHERFQQAARRLRHIADARMYMPHASPTGASTTRLCASRRRAAGAISIPRRSPQRSPRRSPPRHRACRC
jgi:hypothetical protein